MLASEMAPSENNRRARVYRLTSAGRRRLKTEAADWKQFSLSIRRLLQDSLWQDLRFALRMLRRNPGLAAVSFFSLAIGIGFNTALFTLVDALLFRPLPVERVDQLVDVFTSLSDGSPHGTSSYPDFLDFNSQNDVFSDMLGYSPSIDAIICLVPIREC